MIVKSEFRVDSQQLHYSRDKDGLLSHLKNRAAMDLGVKICEQFPFKLDKGKSFDRDRCKVVPEFFGHPDQQPFEYYSTEMMVIPLEKWREFTIKLQNITNFTLSSQDRHKIIDLLQDLNIAPIAKQDQQMNIETKNMDRV